MFVERVTSLPCPSRHRLFPVSLQMLAQFRSAAVVAILFGFASASMIGVEVAVGDAPSGWTAFHGTDNHGWAAATSLPSRWAQDDYAWKIETAAADVGSVSIREGRIFFLASDPDKRQIVLHCHRLVDGAMLWKLPMSQNPHHTHARNSLAAGTPSVDGDGVVFAYAEDDHTHLVAVDHDGKPVWQRDFGPWLSQHGFGTSPRLFDGKVALLVSRQAEQLPEGVEPSTSKMVCVDRLTGRNLWETPLKATRTCYGMPAVRRVSGGVELLDANTGNGVFAIDAQDGRLKWELPVIQKRVVSSPLLIGDTLIATDGAGGRGKLTAVGLPGPHSSDAKVIYTIDRSAPYVPTPAVADGIVFLVDDKGVASAIDPASGTVHWTRRIGGNHGPSPVVIGDRLLLISLDGTATTTEATAQAQPVERFELGGSVAATPAAAEGWVVLRIGRNVCGLQTGSTMAVQ